VHGADQVLVAGGGGEHDDGGPVRRVVQCSEHGVPAKSGHVQVEQQHVRAGGRDDVDRLPAVSGFADDVDIWFLAEQVAQSVPDDAVVIGDHHADRHGTGTRMVSAAPRPATGMLSAVVAPLAAGGLPVWVVSSYDGDLVLVPADRLDEASEVLQAAGHQVRR
jgi:hypothetical protein